MFLLRHGRKLNIVPASFLDARLLANRARPMGWRRWRPSNAVLRQIKPRPLHFIFHAGHVGSTLLSRLLDEVPGVLGLREPLPLRTLARSPRPVRAAARPSSACSLSSSRQWSRGFADTESGFVKSTSSATGLAPDLMARLPGSRAVALNLAAEPYICTLLAGEQNWTI